MKCFIEEASLENFVRRISKLDSGLSSRVVVRDERFDMESVIHFVEKHIEIQNAIMLIKDSEDNDFTIFKTCYGENIGDRYEKMLTMLFKHITCLKDSGFADKYIVSCCRKEALEIYHTLEEQQKINPYIKLFDRQKKNEDCCNDYRLYRVAGTGRNFLLKNDYVDWCMNAMKINRYISLSICGFTFQEIKEKEELLDLFAAFSELYLLFCGDDSVGGYIIRK